MTQKAKKKISRQGAIYRVALAGICTALALLLVWLSVLARYGTLAFFSAAALVIMIPIHKRYYLSAFFAYAVSAGLSVLVGDLASVMGYIVYFGPMALLLGILVNKNVKWFLALPLQIAYCVGALALLYFAVGTVVLRYENLEDIPFWAFVVVGVPALCLINYVLVLAYERILPKVTSVLRDNEQGENTTSNPADSYDEDENPFEEFDTFVVPVKREEQDGQDKETDKKEDEK